MKFSGDETLPNGSKQPLPPAILASLGNDPSKPTLCVYGHLDVQPAALEDGWDTEPFVLTEVSLILSATNTFYWYCLVRIFFKQDFIGTNLTTFIKILNIILCLKQ